MVKRNQSIDRLREKVSFRDNLNHTMRTPGWKTIEDYLRKQERDNYSKLLKSATVSELEQHRQALKVINELFEYIAWKVREGESASKELIAIEAAKESK